MSTRVVHCKREPFDVYVGRPSKYGNPFRIRLGESREEAVAQYRAWLLAPERALLRAAARRELRDRVIGCWCAPQLCHGDVLKEVAESADDAALGIGTP